MKQVIADTGGRPFANDDFLTLQAELTAAVQAQFLGKGPFILSGCQVSGAGPSYNVSAGIVCLDGQLLRFTGAGAVTLPMQLQAGAAVLSDPRPYQTGGTKNCMREVPAVLVASDPAYTAGEFLALDTWGGKRWDDVQRATVRYVGEIQPLGSAGYVSTEYDTDGIGKPGTPAWGWALLDGQGGRADARTRVIAGASDANVEYALGATGGNASVTLRTANLPPNPAGTADVFTYTGNGAYNIASSSPNHWEGRQPPAGIGEAFDNRPPFIALPYRQWVGY